MLKASVKALKYNFLVSFIIISLFLGYNEAGDFLKDSTNEKAGVSGVRRHIASTDKEFESSLSYYYMKFIVPLYVKYESSSNVVLDFVSPDEQDQFLQLKLLELIRKKRNLKPLVDGTYTSASMFLSFMFWAFKDKCIILYNGDNAESSKKAEEILSSFVDFGMKYSTVENDSEIVMVNIGISEMKKRKMISAIAMQSKVFFLLEQYFNAYYTGLSVVFKNILVGISRPDITNKLDYLKNAYREVYENVSKTSGIVKTAKTINSVNVNSPFTLFESIYVGTPPNVFFNKILSVDDRRRKVFMIYNSNSNDNMEMLESLQNMDSKGLVFDSLSYSNVDYDQLFNKMLSIPIKKKQFWGYFFFHCRSQKFPFVIVKGAYCVDGDIVKSILDAILQKRGKEESYEKAKFLVIKPSLSRKKSIEKLEKKLKAVEEEINTLLPKADSFGNNYRVAKLRSKQSNLIHKLSKLRISGHKENVPATQKVFIEGYGYVKFNAKFSATEYIRGTVMDKLSMLVEYISSKRNTVIDVAN